MLIGPAPIDHQKRLQIANSIADKLSSHFGDKLIAIGLCGSLAQGTDAPYSDIEMHCVVDEPGLDSSVEWSAGDWKAEVDLRSVNAIMKRAARVDITWAVTHSVFVYTQPLYDPTNLFIHLRKTAISQPATQFQKAMRQLMIEELYELTGKIRNMDNRKDYSMQAYYAVSLARCGAYLIGLDNRFVYPSGGAMLKTSLTLDNRPQGYDTLCQMVMSGALSESGKLVQTCEDYWEGVNTWSTAKGLRLVDNLEELLRNAQAKIYGSLGVEIGRIEQRQRAVL